MDQTGKPDAYTSFKNDRFRLKALVSRDIRLVAIAAVLVISQRGLAEHGIAWVARLFSFAA